ncbi:hypothetical protein [Desulfopila aestuarii]|uniref:Uncharacterized protein n=1 Tax=Desulfopila aestuarii DSM 18488 TaxID=1121416 RepID=A0A1M7XYQ8_9BACT|nr:hypothetical protein [Desulfopila aestuarii]SHO44187.1 hypothetical protein SAMN02745220_00690 [Desulfopila aestuarii DSM 18488]
MPEKINWNVVAQVMKGPSISAAASVEVDAYDKFQITLLDTVTQVVNLVPGGTISLLVINPKKPDEKLTYDLGGTDVKLDGPHILIGTGAVGLLGGVTSLSFTNNTGADATIEILIGRDATP